MSQPKAIRSLHKSVAASQVCRNIFSIQAAASAWHRILVRGRTAVFCENKFVIVCIVDHHRHTKDTINQHFSYIVKILTWGIFKELEPPIIS